jgi:protein-tyrosine phosphatase
MAEGMLRLRLADLGIAAEVRSAGLYESGLPATDRGVTTMARRGIDLAGHRSRRLDPAALDRADLVLGMERRHIQEAVLLDPSARERAFTLADLARRAMTVEPRRPGETLRTWAGRVAGGRTTAELLGVGDDAVADPVGRSLATYSRTAAEIDDLLAAVVAAAWPGAPVATSVFTSTADRHGSTR